MSESRRDLTLAAALELLDPLVELLLQEGVAYPRLADALKASFLRAGEKILEANASRVNDSSLSTLTGVHRKDVRAWRSEGRTPTRAKSVGPVTEIYTRWASDPAFCDANGKPKILDRSGGQDSFEALALAVSKDVHPHALLQEMMRLGIVRWVEPICGPERLELCVDAFVPKADTAEMLQLFSDNVGDHIAAAANNLRGRAPMLERAVFADELTVGSAAALSALARRLWSDVFRKVVREATSLSQIDADKPDANQRIRFGMYYYHGPMDKP